MKNYNTDLSEEAFAALERIQTLRAVSQKTGFKTDQEQFKILVSLSNLDVLAVADALYKEKQSGGAK